MAVSTCFSSKAQGPLFAHIVMLPLLRCFPLLRLPCLFSCIGTTCLHCTKQNIATTVVTDPEDPRFDLEKLIAKWEAESK